MSEEVINQEFANIQEEAQKAARQVELYTRKLMVPIWEKRRDTIKKIPGFWTQAIGNTPLFLSPSENDIEAVENLTDFHVEYDEARPDYRKVVATFKKNDVFKNETLTKPSKKRKADEDDESNLSFLEFFGSNDNTIGGILADDIFPGALEYFQGEDDEDDEDADEIDLGSEDDEEEEGKLLSFLSLFGIHKMLIMNHSLPFPGD
ncbi:hypothetical protein BDB00DRAFT_758242 [Zychaea mexicana]|uniref:uncharacterized protein n=1 Tax=Zychaea mexicana TaxID=64656 RepID=UPI0022FE0EFC|nr:uncharacterized protein BDB00DRAFT_758242 [Zychaea mexicana]KAI9496462.1 hypothetical protein BDB00DRAFT_758242 [Zychaea mexicana]